MKKVRLGQKVILWAVLGFCMMLWNTGAVNAEGFTCESGGTKYISFKEAVAAVEEGGSAVVTMLSDETMTNSVVVDTNKNITLDLAGFAVDYPDCSGYSGIQIDSGSFTLKDSVGTGTFSVGNEAFGMIRVNGGKFIMNGGSIIHNENAGSNEKAIVTVCGGITINGGTIQTKIPFQFYGKFDVLAVTINDGTFMGELNSIISGDVTAEINGGNFTASEDDEALMIDLTEYHSNVPRVGICGGTYHGNKAGISVYHTDYYKQSVFGIKDLLKEGYAWSNPAETHPAENVASTANDVTVYPLLTEKDVMISGITDADYTGADIRPEPVIVYQGKVLKKGVDYEISYVNNRNAGTAQVMITFTGSYKGTITKSFVIRKQQEEEVSVVTIKKGSILKTEQAVYKVTKVTAAGGEVAYTGQNGGNQSSITIPSVIKIEGKSYKVTAVAKDACKNRKKLARVTIGSNVTVIGTNAFYGCKSLKTVAAGRNIVTIGNGAFRGCGKLNKITIGAKAASIGERAFYGCVSLTKIAIPSKVKKIGKQAFYGCKKLKSIVIKTSALNTKTVGKQAFKKIPAKAVVRAPKRKVKTYEKLLRSRGMSRLVKVKRI